MNNSEVSINQPITLKNDSNIKLFIKREDQLHHYISGNKYRKLKYNVKTAQAKGYEKLLTFGGAFSNHIAATAYAGKLYGINTIGVIRGDELEDKIQSNPTLKFAKSCGMQFHFVSRTKYRSRNDINFLETLESKYGSFYSLPEGGTNALAIKGCEEILTTSDCTFDFICVAVGTGGTISGIINTSKSHQKILGFPALKGDFLKQDICKFVTKENWELITDYNFGGYGKVTPHLITFINTFKSNYNVPLDPIYTGKMMYGIFDLLNKGYFFEGAKILVIHTGGLQGVKGMNIKLKRKKIPLILE